MATLVVSESRRIPAPPREVYAIIADYTEGHPHIMPSAYFRNIEVRRGVSGGGRRFGSDGTGSVPPAQFIAEIENPGRGGILAEAVAEGRPVPPSRAIPRK